MKSETPPLATFAPATIDPFQAFFESLESPAALCDGSLRLLAANAAFEQLIGVRDSVGQNLSDLLIGIAEALPQDGVPQEIEVECRTGQAVRLTLSRRGQTVAVMARAFSRAVDAAKELEAGGRALLEHARVEGALLKLGREVATAGSEEELVAVVARGVKGLFSGRTFCIRVTDPRTGGLTSLYAEGRMKEGAREVVWLKRSAAEKTNLVVGALPKDRVRLTDEEVPLCFVGSVRGISAPLAASGQLFGAIHVEYPAGLSADLLADDRILIQLANQVAVAIRNAKLIDELTFVRKYLEELLEHGNALILVVNRERRVIVFNRLIQERTGLPKEAALGKDLLELVPEEERRRVERVFQASLKGERENAFETRLQGDGKEVRVSFATSAVMSPLGEVEGVIAIGQDLTVIKELEKRIIHAEKLSSLGQLAASVVHEINNPMTAVRAYADAMLRKWQHAPSADPADAEKAQKILENSDRILRFTRDLVSYARPAQDRPEQVDVHQTLDMAVGFCDHVLRQHGVAVAKRYEKLPPISAVKGNLVQVFVNLITNACHAMGKGGAVTITTSLGTSSIVVRIEDTGSGIAPKDKERIFEPFFTTKPDGRGTGLASRSCRASSRSTPGTSRWRVSLAAAPPS